MIDPLPTERLGGCPDDASPSQFRGSTAPMARAMRQLPLADAITLGGARGSAPQRTAAGFREVPVFGSAPQNF